MYIRSIVINNFGPIKNLDLKLNNRINYISGQNASGKTHIFYALYYLFNSEKVLRTDKNTYEDFIVSSNIEEEENIYRLKKVYTNNEAQLIFGNLEEAKKVSNLINRNKIIFFSGDFFDNNFEISRNEVLRIVSYLEKLQISNESKNMIKSIINVDRFIDNEHVYLISRGDSALLRLLDIITKSNSYDVFIADSIFCDFDNNILSCVMDIIEALPKTQFILIQDISNLRIDFNKYNTQFIPLNQESLNTIGCSYSHKIDNIFEEVNKDEDMIIFTKYIVDNILIEEECRNMEFKEIKGNNPCSSIIKNAINYVVAYLNVLESIKGSILWGINDDRKVCGVSLSYPQRDEIRRKLCESFSQITPHISPELYTISFHDVYSNGSKVEGKYIVEVVVKNDFKSKYLYSTPQNEVFIKTQGGRIKLTIQEVQEELIYRLTNN